MIQLDNFYLQIQHRTINEIIFRKLSQSKILTDLNYRILSRLINSILTPDIKFATRVLPL